MSESSNGIALSLRQQQTVAAGITVLCATIVIAFTVALVWLLARFLEFFSGVFLPLASALILALVFKPLYDLYHEKFKWSPVGSVLAFYASILIPIGVFLWIFGASLCGQAVEMIHAFPEFYASVSADIKSRWPDLVALYEKYAVGEKVEEALQDNSGALSGLFQQVTESLTAGLGNAVGFVTSLVGLAILPVYLGFFLMIPNFKPEKLSTHLPFLKEQTRADAVFLVKEFLEILVTFFRGQLLIAFLQGILFAIGFSLVGLKYGFVLGFTLGFLNIVPYLGSMIGLGVALPTAYVQPDGGFPLLLLVIGVFAAVQTIEGYILTPKIMGDRTGLHPVVIMFAIFFWGTALSGIAGMILAIPLTAFFVIFWRLARERYVPEII